MISGRDLVVPKINVKTTVNCINLSGAAILLLWFDLIFRPKRLFSFTIHQVSYSKESLSNWFKNHISLFPGKYKYIEHKKKNDLKSLYINTMLQMNRPIFVFVQRVEIIIRKIDEPNG